MFRHGCRLGLGLEVVISKRAASRYKLGRWPQLGEGEEPGLRAAMKLRTQHSRQTPETKRVYGSRLFRQSLRCVPCPFGSG
jgi:hypothetical protein